MATIPSPDPSGSFSALDHKAFKELFPASLQKRADIDKIVENVIQEIEAQKGTWIKEMEPPVSLSSLLIGSSAIASMLLSKKHLEVDGRKFEVTQVQLNDKNKTIVKIKAMVTSDGQIFLLFGKAKDKLGDGALKKVQKAILNEERPIAFLSQINATGDVQKGIDNEMQLLPKLNKLNVPGLIRTQYIINYSGNAIIDTKTNEKTEVKKTAWVQPAYRGDLSCFKTLSHLFKKPRPKWTDMQKIDFLTELCQILVDLHGKELEHNDLKCDNILEDIGEDGNSHPILTDFDRLTKIGESVSETSLPICGPEVFPWDEKNWKPDTKQIREVFAKIEKEQEEILNNPEIDEKEKQSIAAKIKEKYIAQAADFSKFDSQTSDIYAFGHMIEEFFMEVLWPDVYKNPTNFVKDQYDIYSLPIFPAEGKNEEPEIQRKKRHIKTDPFTSKLYETVCKIKQHRPEDRPNASQVLQLLKELKEIAPTVSAASSSSYTGLGMPTNRAVAAVSSLQRDRPLPHMDFGMPSSRPAPGASAVSSTEPRGKKLPPMDFGMPSSRTVVKSDSDTGPVRRKPPPMNFGMPSSRTVVKPDTDTGPVRRKPPPMNFGMPSSRTVVKPDTDTGPVRRRNAPPPMDFSKMMPSARSAPGAKASTGPAPALQLPKEFGWAKPSQ